MVTQKRRESVEYVLRERKFSGTPDEILPQLDELIELLFGFRKLLLSGEATRMLHSKGSGGRMERSRTVERRYTSRDRARLQRPAEQTVKALTTTLEYRAPLTQSSVISRLEHRVDNSTGAQGGFVDDFGTSPGVIALRPTQHLSRPRGDLHV